MSVLDDIVPALPVSARDWNLVAEELRRNRPLRITPVTRGGWAHPWKTTQSWDNARARWSVSIKPGFVNGGEVEIELDADEAPEATVQRLGRAAVYRAYLTELPARSVHPGEMRRIGPDGTPDGASASGLTYEPVPPFFKAMGVGDPPGSRFDLATAEFTDILEPNRDRSQERLLRAYDIVLTQERLATTVRWAYEGSVSAAQFDVVYANTGHRELPYISIRKRHFDALDRADALDLLGGLDEPDPQDEIKIATCYLVSPPGAEPGSDPDGTWGAFAKHGAFWNINYSTNILPTRAAYEPVTFDLPLAGGVSQQAVNTLLATNNDALDAATEFLNGRRLDGRFWTT